MSERSPVEPSRPTRCGALDPKRLPRSIAWKLVARWAIREQTYEADLALVQGLFGYQQSGDLDDPFAPAIEAVARQDLVSIVVPAYNAGAYIAEALDSLVAQTHRSLQVIVVDDGSTDNTRKIADRYQQRHGFELVHLPRNRGLAHAKNEGLRLARGEWIGFLCADDVFYPDAIETLVRALRSNPEAGLAFSDFEYFGTCDYAGDGDPVERLGPIGIDGLFRTGVTVGMCALFQRSLLSGLRGPVEEAAALTGVEDTVLWQDLWRRAAFTHVPRVLGKYRRHNGQLTRTILRSCGYEVLLSRSRERYQRRYGATRRLLFVYPACCIGGAERVMAQLAVGLRSRGIACEACFTEDGGGAAYFASCCPTTVLDEVRGDGSRTQALARHIAAGNYDLISSSFSEEIVEAVGLADYRRPIVEVDHGWPARCQADRLQPSALVTVSRYQARALQEYGIETPARVIYNGIDWRRYADAASVSAAHLPHTRGPIVAWVGRIHGTKRPRLFLEVVEKLSARMPTVEFRMVGSVSYYTRADDVEVIAAACRAYPRLRFVPGVTPSSMPFFYGLVRATGGVLVLTSLDEPFGLVTIEAMACGIPVIASRSGGAQEIIDDGTDGMLLSEPYSPEAAGEAAARLLTDPLMYASLSQHAQAKVAAKFSLDAMTQAYADLYDEACGHSRKGQRGRAHAGP
jgi:glycosyltransferase involved in cell wall biosynthesis